MNTPPKLKEEYNKTRLRRTLFLCNITNLNALSVLCNILRGIFIQFSFIKNHSWIQHRFCKSYFKEGFIGAKLLLKTTQSH